MNWPFYSNKIANSVKNTIKSGKVNYWTGNLCSKFEKNFSKFINIKYCCSISNASVGLEIALNALDDLQKQNTYIEQTAFKVAPDYLELAYQYESKYNSD